MKTDQEGININFESRIDFTLLKNKLDSLREEIAKVIVGQQEWVDLLLTAILADGHVLVEGGGTRCSKNIDG